MITEQDKKIEALVDAVDLVMDDMGRTGQSCSEYAKAVLRIAFEPFRSEHDISDGNFIMPLAYAQEVVYEAENT